MADKRRGDGFVLLARHRWVTGCVISESAGPDAADDPRSPAVRSFTATIDGWQGWQIYRGPMFPGCAERVRAAVTDIQRRIRAGDESVFHEKGPWVQAPDADRVETASE